MSDDRNDGKPQRSRRCKAVRPCLAAAPVTTTGLTGSALAEPRAVASDTTVGTGGSPAKDATERSFL